MLQQGDTTAAMRTRLLLQFKTRVFFAFFLIFEKNIRGAPVPLPVAHLVVRHAYLDITVAHHAVRHGYEIAVARGPWRTASAPRKAFLGAPRIGVFIVVQWRSG